MNYYTMMCECADKKKMIGVDGGTGRSQQIRKGRERGKERVVGGTESWFV